MLFTTTIALTGESQFFYISSDQYLKLELKKYFELETEKHLFCSKLQNIQKGEEN